MPPDPSPRQPGGAFHNGDKGPVERLGTVAKGLVESLERGYQSFAYASSPDPQKLRATQETVLSFVRFLEQQVAPLRDSLLPEDASAKDRSDWDKGLFELAQLGQSVAGRIGNFANALEHHGASKDKEQTPAFIEADERVDNLRRDSIQQMRTFCTSAGAFAKTVA
jgi:hypothetical protein